jgi:hypothetical protein
MGRPPSNDDSGLKKGPWTPEEDQKLVKYIQKHGHGSWRALPKLAGMDPLHHSQLSSLSLSLSLKRVFFVLLQGLTDVGRVAD